MFCHEWTQIKDGEMCAAELDENFNIKGEIKTLFKASDAPWVVELKGHNAFITDGPFLWRLKSGKLLMLWSSFGKNGYAMGMAVSDSIMGKWNHIKEPLIYKNGGHGMMYTDGERLFVTYHCPNDPHGEERPIIQEVEEIGDCIAIKNGY